MKKLKRLAALTLALLMMTGCTGNGDVTTSPESAPQTDAQTAAPEEKTVSLSMTSAELANGSFKLTVRSDGDFDGKITLTLKSEKGEDTVVSEASFKKDTDIVLSSTKVSEIGESFSLKVTASSSGEEADVLECEYKRGLPQLSADNIGIVVEQLTNEEKASLCLLWTAGQYSGKTYAVARLGIPSIIMTDGPNGPRVSNATYAHPTSSLLAQSWNTELVYKVGESMGKDFRNCGVDIGLTPGVNIQKYLLGGRNFEYFSEDPYLSGMMGIASVNGVQSTGTGTSLKHFVANNYEFGRQGNSVLTERALREIYSKAFKYVLTESDPFTVMTSYNMINGVRSNSSFDLVTTFLKDELGYKGTVLSDWGAQGEKTDMLNAGLNIYCDVQDNSSYVSKIVSAVNSKKLKQEALDDSARTVLHMVVKTHTFNGTGDKTMRVEDIRNKRVEMRKIAAEGMVLLKNADNTLPLKSGEVALYGSGSKNLLFGGYGSSLVKPSKKTNIADAIKGSEVLSLNGAFDEQYKNCKTAGYTDSGIAEDIEVDIPEAQVKSAAKSSAVAVMTISRGPAEGYDIPTGAGGYRLSATEEKMIKRISDAFHAEGKKFIVLLNVANALETASWEKYVDAILLVGFAGEETADAAIDILTGKVTPSGKLTNTWPVDIKDIPESEYPYGGTVYYYEDIYAGYRYYTTFGVDVAYPFGYGMSYTSFEYSDFSISSDKFTDEITATVTVKNTGSVAGKEAVQFYLSKPDGVNEQAKYELCGFAKTKELAPGESQTVTVKITKTELETYITERSDYVIEKGEYTISVASSVTNIKDAKKFSVDSEILVSDVTNICTPRKEVDILTKETGKVTTTGRVNLALNKPTNTDFAENDKYLAEYAVDGDLNTRWSAPNGNNSGHYLTVDLGKAYKLDMLKISWESITSSEFEVHTSIDGKKWEKKKFDFQTLFADMEGVEARYVKVLARNSGWLSIYEIEVYEK